MTDAIGQASLVENYKFVGLAVESFKIHKTYHAQSPSRKRHKSIIRHFK